MPAQATDVLTYHNDNARTGQNLNEEILSPANVNTNHFGKLWVLPADGLVDAQPLYAAGVNLPSKGLRNVVFIATENDSVYAYDADSTNLFWRVSMLGTNEVPSDNRGCNQVTPEIGITATPVIDRQLGPNGTIFVVAMSKQVINGTNAYFQRLHALDLATGTNRLPAVTIAAIYPGTGENSDGTNVIFDPAQYKERCGLLLLGGVVYTSWASHCDDQPYTGWIIGYDEHTLAQTSVLNITPNGGEAAIWMSGAGLAADAASNIYFLAGNGTFDTTPDHERISRPGRLRQRVYETLDHQQSAGRGGLFYHVQHREPRALPTRTSAPAARSCCRTCWTGRGICASSPSAPGRTAIFTSWTVQTWASSIPPMTTPFTRNSMVLCRAACGPCPLTSMTRFITAPSGNHLQAFPFQNARLTNSSSQTAFTFAYPGTTPSISANGSSNGIVWAAENASPAVLHAYSPTNLAHEFYNSTQVAGGRDNFGNGNKFITPMIASARVYVGTTTGVGVLGLLDQSTLTPLQIWRNNYFRNPSNVGAGANGASPAGDGVPNLIKYALGLNPTNAATTAQLPTGGVQPDGGTNYLTLTVHRAAQPSDITYIVEVTSSLTGGWVSGPPNTVTLSNTATLLVVRDNTPQPAATTRFIRLLVTNP